ncbi:hypothetical protein [Umezakia ovalisporum]|uniref:Uncharacterized protein n=1 Tax=Umezakia ovalisporum FSS-43 TaxID=2740520 RepID=A0ABT6K194_9CYAN|nr:hypothetical protein [Umezakia ovalisporum]MDH6056066.1 hypothetical protein [Umezakia ovalisporum FSS-43]MDH6068251.1 hypothetical protein [Umezakia ovalisporum APH033B]MDH6069894.1 hypothetical protein [Umezakia ovalisporum CobakiLakeA]MDH6074269.1 hypothetical protein [Umezakia ovalisporum CS-1034]MDH6077147.1 hypothetical protein [Umezakia ovalisporum FSS-45]
MAQLERLLQMAEDELIQYSTDARKIEKLRRKIALSMSLAEQRQIKAELLITMKYSTITNIVEEQRQVVALPFWGIAGLGFLFGISANQPVVLCIGVLGSVAAFRIQKWGWKLQAKRLLLQTLEDIEARISPPSN